MSESKNKNLIGQPILTQGLALVIKSNFSGLVTKIKSDIYYEKFYAWTHFVSMMFAIAAALCLSY